MTRIIAGGAGSLTLAVPDAGTRPTSDRVRESLFGSLESADAVRDAVVLDLFAGSGALGLEALSRGAAAADLVDKAPRAASVAERNARAVAKALGTPEFPRVRVGIGRPPGRQDPADWVLDPFSAAERMQLPLVLADAADAVEQLIDEGLLDAQQRHHAPRA